jgi:hypothetical protein
MRDRRRWTLGLALATAAVALPALALTSGAEHAPGHIALTPGETYTITCETAFEELAYQQEPGSWEVTCRPLPATATSEPTATATATHAMPTPGVTLGWHGPASHDGLNAHEHGDAPPAWVLASEHPPFTQTRESHTGYKGAYDVSPGGAQSYLIAHIVSTEMARMHGDHDYQLWLRDPESGQVWYWEGVLCFAEPCTAPIPERTSDTGERPIALGERSPSDGCETWYDVPGGVVDVGWTMCQRYQRFDGSVLGGDGSFRTVDWIIPCGGLPQALQDNCRNEFGVRRLSFLVQSREYETGGSVEPVN